MRWRRIETGWYCATTSNGTTYEVVNMAGQSVRHSGLDPTWELRRVTAGAPKPLTRGVRPDWESVHVDWHWTMTEAREAAHAKQASA